MYSYNIFQWVLFFFVYCFFGWVYETTVVSLREKKFVNRGFLKSPFLPIYGFGAIMILICTIPVSENPFWVYVCGMVGATVLEYLTGWVMEMIFKVKYWDYSKKYLNINGYICLECTLIWGFFSLLMTYIVHKPIEKIVLNMSATVNLVLVIILSSLFVADFIISFKTAVDMAKYLDRLYKLKEEFDVMAYIKLEETEEAIKDKSFMMKKELVEDFRELYKNKTREIEVRMVVLQSEREELLNKIGFFKKSLLNSFPRATSRTFGNTVNEIREYYQNRHNKD